MNHEYYERFKIFTENRVWESYLKWAYETCLNDLNELSFYPDFSVDGFTALLCGTSGERTSLHFTDFILSKNLNAKILIIDISESQIEHSREVLNKEFPKADIQCLQANALYTNFKAESINYIETDAFFEFFDLRDLILLFEEWYRILVNGGFVTTRAFASDSFLEKRLDFIRVMIAEKYLNINIHVHNMQDIIDVINKTQFEYVHGGHSYCPTFKRFSFLKRQ